VDEEARNRATEFLKELYAAGDIDAGRFDAGVAGLLAATSDAELAGVVRSLPAPWPSRARTGGWPGRSRSTPA
jgi:hypothetical protein